MMPAEKKPFFDDQWTCPRALPGRPRGSFKAPGPGAGGAAAGLADSDSMIGESPAVAA
jgi:hypothetical protein